MPIVVEGINELKKTLSNMTKAIDPQIKTMAEVGRIMLKDFDEMFATNGHGTWKANAPSTRPGVGGILEFTGKMRKSIELRLGKNFAECKPANSVYKYAAVNHYGSRSGRIPARPFLILFSLDDITKTIGKPIDEAMKK